MAIVRPVDASEPIQLDIVESHGTKDIVRGADGKPIQPNKAGEILLRRGAFREIRCKVERVLKGQDWQEITLLTHAYQPETGGPHAFPSKLETGKSALVFLVKPDDRG